MARTVSGRGQDGGPLEVQLKSQAIPSLKPRAIVEQAWLAAHLAHLDRLGAGTAGDRLALAAQLKPRHLTRLSAPWQVPPADLAQAFLISGTLRVERDNVHWLESEGVEAHHALEPGSWLYGEGPDGAELIEVPRALIEKPPREPLGSQIVPEAFVLEALIADLYAQRLRLPAMPRIAFLLRERTEDPRVNLQEIAEIAQSDGAIAGRLLHVANSAAFAGGPRHQTVFAAVQRLGIKTTQTLVLSLALKQVFALKHLWVKAQALQCWRFSVTLSAAAYAVAERAGLDGQVALIAGLVHQIGQVPILAAIETLGFPLDAAFLDPLMDRVARDATAQVHAYWRLDQSAADAAKHWNNWGRHHEGPGDYGDVAQVAAHFCLTRHGPKDELPPLNELSGLKALGLAADEASLEDLRLAMDTNVAMMGPLLHG